MTLGQSAHYLKQQTTSYDRTFRRYFSFWTISQRVVYKFEVLLTTFRENVSAIRALDVKHMEGFLPIVLKILIDLYLLKLLYPKYKLLENISQYNIMK